MQTHMPKLGAALVVIVLAMWANVWVTPTFAENAFVEVTGQTTSHADGDDGDIQAGVPFPTPRFKHQGDGTVEDRLTGLIWLKDANCFGIREWASALFDAGTLASPNCGLADRSVAGDWRLPNVKELQSLIDFGFFNPALSNAAGTAKWTQGDAFSGVRSGHYWSSTTIADRPGDAWLVDLNDGFTDGGSKGFNFGVWPVREGK